MCHTVGRKRRLLDSRGNPSADGVRDIPRGYRAFDCRCELMPLIWPKDFAWSIVRGEQYHGMLFRLLTISRFTEPYVLMVAALRSASRESEVASKTMVRQPKQVRIANTETQYLFQRNYHEHQAIASASREHDPCWNHRLEIEHFRERATTTPYILRIP